jgi:hypothetical protein
VPSVVDATRVCVAAGSPGITVHPRADARHITFDDVRQISEELRFQTCSPWRPRSCPISSRWCRCGPAR